MAMADFEQTAAGRLVDELLARPATLARMEELSRQGRPAVGALDEQLAGRVTLGHTERQYVGRRVRAKMADHGWKTGLQRRLSGGKVLTSGTVYFRGESPVADRFATVPTDLLPIQERIARAQAIIRNSGITDFSIDTYLEEKRTEVEAEEREMTRRYGKPVA